MRACGINGPILAGYADRELDAAAMSFLAAHLKVCRACRGEVAAQRSLRARLRAAFARFRSVSVPLKFDPP